MPFDEERIDEHDECRHEITSLRAKLEAAERDTAILGFIERSELDLCYSRKGWGEDGHPWQAIVNGNVFERDTAREAIAAAMGHKP